MIAAFIFSSHLGEIIRCIRLKSPYLGKKTSIISEINPI